MTSTENNWLKEHAVSMIASFVLTLQIYVAAGIQEVPIWLENISNFIAVATLRGIDSLTSLVGLRFSYEMSFLLVLLIWTVPILIRIWVRRDSEFISRLRIWQFLFLLLIALLSIGYLSFSSAPSNALMGFLNRNGPKLQFDVGPELFLLSLVVILSTVAILQYRTSITSNRVSLSHLVILVIPYCFALLAVTSFIGDYLEQRISPDNGVWRGPPSMLVSGDLLVDLFYLPCGIIILSRREVSAIVLNIAVIHGLAVTGLQFGG